MVWLIVSDFSCFGLVLFGLVGFPLFGFGSVLVSVLVWGGPQARTKFLCRALHSSSLSASGIAPLETCYVSVWR